jgi:hypothetical protein
MPPAIILAARALGIPFLAGINLYITVFALGLIKKLTGATVLGPEFDVLASWPVLIIAGALVVVEIVADKVPAVDHVWDAVHTFIRAPGAMVVMAILMQGENVTWQVVAILVAGGVSFVAHSGKATARVASSKATATVANAAISVLEDVFVAVGSILAAFYPVVLGAVVLVALVAAAIFAPKLFRAFRISWVVSANYVRYLWHRLRRWLNPEWRPEAKAVGLPPALQDLALKEEPLGAARVLEGKFGRRRFAYVAVWRDRLALAVRRVVKQRVRVYYYRELADVYVGEDTLLERLFFSAPERGYVLSFLKGREPTAAEVADLIAEGQAKP